jgi:hypothetical protein
MRSRNIKPGFLENEYLAECEPLARLLFTGLWMMADREGRLEDRPLRIKRTCLGYDNCDIEDLLGQLARTPNGQNEPPFIIRYQINGTGYIQIVNFRKHQNPHCHEPKSSIPPINSKEAQCMDSTCTVQAPDDNGSRPADSLIPDSLIPDSLIPEKNTPTNRPAACAVCVPIWLDKTLWEDFKAHRVTLRSKMTLRAEQLILNKLEAAMKDGHDPNEMIRQSIERGWKGVFPRDPPLQIPGMKPGMLSEKGMKTALNMKRFLEDREHGRETVL